MRDNKCGWYENEKKYGVQKFKKCNKHITHTIRVNVYYNKDENGNIEYDFEQIREDFEEKLLKLED
tara:strand:+ start:2402 stop:2599 length:198 start_codon:yes stop_codon:yes gene_type:complete